MLTIYYANYSICAHSNHNVEQKEKLEEFWTMNSGSWIDFCQSQNEH